MNWVKAKDQLPDSTDIVFVITETDWDAELTKPSLGLWDGKEWTIQPFKRGWSRTRNKKEVLLWKRM